MRDWLQIKNNHLRFNVVELRKLSIKAFVALEELRVYRKPAASKLPAPDGAT
jgi:hypothetical protein